MKTDMMYILEASARGRSARAPEKIGLKGQERKRTPSLEGIDRRVFCESERSRFSESTDTIGNYFSEILTRKRELHGKKKEQEISDPTKKDASQLELTKSYSSSRNGGSNHESHDQSHVETGHRPFRSSSSRRLEDVENDLDEEPSGDDDLSDLIGVVDGPAASERKNKS